ncbi:two-component system, response regulator YesN [Pseudobutyrivibrio sp. YE44]|uniref:response regulator transcription factor n=1 Tax=Pseudobutyrivibrio sp. YE44 TaxID=1520802 RepID=UPI00088C1E51|nr:response regulator [Pseudobutyrivibrio sp. YE44]SDB51732.1 two-component system, response regulator YesN [Pseudobutyrivibrio sp. YE44]
MYSVFLVEDEIVIRDGLKASFPWEQHGFAYVGDAADGEMALPQIRQTKPDVIITDIRMPFMDGIALSKIIKKELPNTRIIIISGFDDFSYAQEAIGIGVDNYLLKPITKDKLGEVMSDVKSKLDKENEKDNYLEQFKAESQEYEQFARVRFFNQLVGGTMSVSEVYEKSEELGLSLDATHYNMVLLDFTPMDGVGSAPSFSKHRARLSEQLMQYLKCCPEYIVFHWSMEGYAIIVKGDEHSIDSLTKTLIENVERRCLVYEDEINWYLAESGTITRISEFSAACDRASKRLGCRFINPSGHIFTDNDIEAIKINNEESETIDIDQRLVTLFLENAEESEIDGFLDNLLNKQTKNSLKSILFCKYFAMTMYMCVSDYLRKLSLNPDVILESDARTQVERVEEDTVLPFVAKMFATVISKRKNEFGKQSKSQLSEAIRYVDEHYCDSNLSLNEVAKEVNISPSYLSAMFSKENKTTFVEYMTAKRMEHAKQMLLTTGEKSQIIAEQVGYKDPHYFSYIFKKTYGLSPKEFRTKERGA